MHDEESEIAVFPKAVLSPPKTGINDASSKYFRRGLQTDLQPQMRLAIHHTPQARFWKRQRSDLNGMQSLKRLPMAERTEKQSKTAEAPCLFLAMKLAGHGCRRALCVLPAATARSGATKSEEVHAVHASEKIPNPNAEVARLCIQVGLDPCLVRRRLLKLCRNS